MKSVLITGASSGIGRELAHIYAQNGYRLLLVARREERLKTIKKDIESLYNSKVHIIAQDLAQMDSADVLFSEVSNRGFIVDVLINNAGFGINASFEKMDIDSEAQMLTLN